MPDQIRPPQTDDDRYDAVVVGAGFGGLGAALTLAERGARVLVLEAMTYPGGCASTFAKDGSRFESGATLFAGFGQGQLFQRWIARHALPVRFRPLDPSIELRAPGLRLPLVADRAAMVAHLVALPDAPGAAIRRFFALQGRVADALWPALDDPALLPRFGNGAIARHLRALPAYLRIAPLLGRTLGDVMRAEGVAGFRPLRLLAESLCTITVQCGAEEAEAPLALAAMDYGFRGAGHVHDGIGTFADSLAGAVRAQGGTVTFGTRVRSIEPCGRGWRVTTNRGTAVAAAVVANLLPHDLRRLLGGSAPATPRIDRLAERVEDGWGAAMLYLVAREPRHACADAAHLDIVQDDSAPFIEGNHLFASISAADDAGRAPAGRRTITVSTHVPMRKFVAMTPDEQGEYVAAIQQRMRDGLARHSPEWWDGVEHELTASPRTFERFTGRHRGYVGGAPRRAGLRNYTALAPRAVLPGLYLVGDSVFPGQSALAAAAGGVKTAEAALRSLDLQASTRSPSHEPDSPARPAAPSAPRRDRGPRGRAAVVRGARRVRVHAEG